MDLLGVVARVVSPALRSVAETGHAPTLDPARMWWRPATPGPMRLAWHVDAGTDATPGSWLEGVHRPVLDPLLAAYRAAGGVPHRVLVGNVASALNGAAAQLRSPRADDLVRGLFDAAELRGAVRHRPPDFRRNSCCLIYRVPPFGLCGDCVLIGHGRGRPRATG